MSKWGRLGILMCLIITTPVWASIGKVSLLKGEAIANRDTQTIALANGAALEEHDLISTRANSQIQLTFEDKTVITLGSESVLDINQYLNDAQEPKAKFKFNQGTFKTITGQIGKKAPENFTLETKTATIGIRGTSVAGILPPSSPANVVSPPEKIFCLSGTIFARSLANPTAPSVTIPAGSVTFITQGTPPTPPRPATPQELQQINQSIGGTPPPLPATIGSNQPPNGNTPPTTSDSPTPATAGDTPPAPSSLGVAPQTFVPTAAANALQTNTQTLSQNTLITSTAKELGIPVSNLQNQTCPTGTTGTYPNCVTQTCPTGTTGTYPNCTITHVGGDGGGTITPTIPTLKGLATASKKSSGITVYTYNNSFSTAMINSNAVGEISLPSSTSLLFNSSSINVTSPTIFTITIPDANVTQISSIASPDSNAFWGKWTSLEMDNNATLLPTANNFWVAGKIEDKVLATSHIASIYACTNEYKTYTYFGKTLGLVYNASGIVFPIDPADATNEIKLVFKFGNSAAPIAWPDSHIQFTANGFWNIGVYPGQAYALADGSFTGMLSSGTIGGNMQGTFYGTNAASLGGIFTANDSNSSSTAIGAFVASKNSSETSYIPVPLTGFATSLYIDGNITTMYSSQDILDFNISNHSSVSGRSTLDGRGNPTIDINASSTSISTFGPSSDNLYWGKWTSTEKDGNATLTAGNDNFWIAGANKATAATYITNLVSDTRTPILTYEGNVIGSTYNSAGIRYAIEEDAFNKVTLQFNLGAANPIDASKSEITFKSHDELWSLKPSGSPFSGSTFTASFNSDYAHIWDENSTRRNVQSGSLNGIFYGSYANAAGGTFQASDYDGITALGVFKTIKTNEFFYPINFYPALATNTIDEGVVNYKGFATSRYVSGGTTYSSISDTFDLSVNTNNGGTSGIISYAARTGDFSLERLSTDDSTLTHIDRNNFAIKDFDAGRGWIQTDNSEPNDYVSWGYWGVHSTDETKLKSTQNYWVGGDETNATLAAAYIPALPANTHYIYTGKVLGTVEQGGSTHAIADGASNSVQLKFDFGGGAGSLYNDSGYSWIKFTANGKQWDLKPSLTTPAVTAGTFSDTLVGTVTSGTSTPITSGSINGKFYGNQAQAVGGTFNAATANAAALGVFKAVRP